MSGDKRDRAFFLSFFLSFFFDLTLLLFGEAPALSTRESDSAGESLPRRSKARRGGLFLMTTVHEKETVQGVFGSM